MNRISEIVKLSPGYKSAINIGNDIDNYEKVSTYIPTETGSRCIELVAKALNPECKERSFLITGTYGTGKSHVAIVLCNLLKHKGITPYLTPVMEKINNKWAERFDEIKRYRTNIEDKPFLIVSLYQDEGRINDALLRGLDKALSSLGLDNFLPETVFTAALKRLNDIRSNHPNALEDLKKVIDEEGLVSIDDFERRLKNYEKEAFEIFLNIHPRFSHGAKFSHHQDMKAAEVYTAAAKRLKEKEFAGIIVIWDEFGRYLERSLEDPKGNESLELQEFAEACNDSYLSKNGGVKLFTFLIAHREMQEYLGLMNAKIAHWKSEEERKAFTIDIQKIQKRFHSEIRMKSNDTEIFDLIDHVIIQQKDKPLWRDIMKKDVLDIWAEKSVNYKIFPDFNKTKILDTIIEGSYPLHPVTTCCLPKLSEKVAQNERTLFQFLCKDESNSVSEFIKQPIKDKIGKLNVITLDLLIEYFQEEAKKSDKTKKVMHEYLNAERLLASSPDIYKKIAKAIAVLNMVSDDRVQLKTTPELITFALNENLETITESLEALSSRNAEEKILTKSSVDGTYRFYGAGSVDINEEIEKIIKERNTTTNPIKFLDWHEPLAEDTTLWVKLDLPISIEPKSYNDDYRMNRVINLKPVDVKGLEGFREIPNDGIQDGMLLIVLCESESEIRKASELISGDRFKEPRLLIAVNKQPINFSNFIRKYDALIRLRYERKEIFGEGAPYKDEWENENSDCIELLRRTFSPLLNPEKNLMDFYWKGEVKKGISSQGRLENLATEMTRDAYPSTPLVLREELKKTDGNDTFKKHRKPVIDNIFREDGPEFLSKEVNAPVKSVIDSVLKANNILVRKHGAWVIEKPADSANMAKVWDIVESFILSCKLPGKPALLLIQSLLSPPFGIRRRSIPIIVAAPLRKFIMRGNITIKEKELPLKSDSDAIESIAANPEKYTIIYAEVGEGQKTIVDGMCKVYGVEISGELGEKIVALKEKLVSWWYGLSNYARKTIDVSEDAKVIREKVFIPLAAEGADVNRIFFEKMPEVLGLDDLAKTQYEKIKEKIYGKVRKVKEEFEKATDNQKGKILGVLTEVFGGGKENDPIKTFTNWHKELKEKGDVIINGDAGKLLTACRQLKEKKDEGVLIDLVTQIIGNKPEDWNSDTILDELKGQLKNIKKTIEGNKTSVVIDKDSIIISITIEGKPITRQFKKTTSISDNGKAMANIINEAIRGIGRSLTEEERFTVLIEVLREHLK